MLYHKQWKLILLTMLAFFTLHTHQESSNEVPLKTSIIIPCHGKHAKHLFPLLKLFEQQTVLPDEIVISISETDLMDSQLLTELNEDPWLFPVVIYTTQEKLYAGQNRNVACSHATGDIFICQDADDIPHPQRIEIIRYFFEHHGVDHLIHELLPLQQNQVSHFQMLPSFDKITFRKPHSFNEVWKAGTVTNGNIAISKNVFKTLKWPNNSRGQDVFYNQTVYKHFKRRIIIYVPLIYYRQYLSTSRSPHPYLGRIAQKAMSLR